MWMPYSPFERCHGQGACSKARGYKTFAHPTEEGWDILDETLYSFKVNMFFQSYDVQGGGDRIMVYLIIYIHHCLKQIVKLPKEKAKKALYTLAQQSFDAPGDHHFILPAFLPNPKSTKESSEWKEYFKQLREELGNRLVEKVYAAPGPDGLPSKWWVMFTKRKFLNKTLAN
eukprot:TRINITY_DN58776_c0_g1_i2.p1 TRINITY_DN58776_c0_g1~~TRINITY_DN58776_c0_g1_i2.p1  ORF type:complete len:172 (-),score=5.16 TRINITY_DN58776_c0_g1_i2:42-557(-)